MVSTTPSSTPCMHCRLPIDPEAHKCPNCLAWQSRLPDPRSPRGIIVLLAVIFAFAAIPVALVRRAFPHPPAAIGSISVIAPTMHHDVDGCGRWLTVVGKLMNASDSSVEDPHLEVRFFNKQEELIDSLTSRDYALVIPPHSEASFRVRDQAAQEAREYARFEVRVSKVSSASGY